MSRSSSVLLSLFAVATVVGGSSCSMTKDMDEMHDATNHLDSLTQDVDKHSQSLDAGSQDIKKASETAAAASTVAADNSTVLKQHTANLFDEDRQGQAVTIRGERINEMKTTADQTAKIGLGGLYFSAFEFQLWTDFQNDDEAKLQQLYLDAVQEFFRISHQFVPASMDPSPKSNSDGMKDIYALAVTMHQINPNEPWIVQHGNALCMLDLIKNSLSAKEAGEAGQTLPAYQVEVLKHPEWAVYMLQVRANFLPVMTLGNISSSLEKGGLSAFFGKIKMLLKSWTSDITTKDVEELDDYHVWMKEANDTGDFLKKLGYDPKFDKTVLKIFDHLRPLSSDTNDKKADLTVRKGLVTQIQSEIERYKAGAK